MRNILVTTRPKNKYAEVHSDFLDMVNIPLTRIVTTFSKDDARKLDDFDPDTVVFTSSTGVDIFLPVKPSFLHGRSVFAIGNSTASRLANSGFSPVVPENRDSQGITDAIISGVRHGSRVALLRSSRPDKRLDEALMREGFDSLSISLYDIVEEIVTGLPETSRIFGFLVTSSMETEILLKRYGVIPDTHYFAIGRTTAEKMSSLGFAVSEPMGNSDFKETIHMIESFHFNKS